MTEMNMNGYEYLFNSKEGQEALKGLQRYGVNDLTPYEEWQLEFYLDNPLPWPRCCELFGQYAKYIAAHDEMPFDAWLATIEYDPALSDGEKEDFDYSEYDKDPLVINFSVGQRLDRGENFDGDPETLEC